jgi:Flp pilus assembly protein TadG
MKNQLNLFDAAVASGPQAEAGYGPRKSTRRIFTLEKVCRICRRYRRGAAVVEFAFVAPLFVMLVFGMIEFGRLVMVQQLLTNATREGARLGVLSETTDTDVKTKVVSYLGSSSITIATSNVIVSYPDSGEAVAVTVSVPFNQVSWLPSPMFLSGYTLSAGSTMRRENVQ